MIVIQRYDYSIDRNNPKIAAACIGKERLTIAPRKPTPAQNNAQKIDVDGQEERTRKENRKDENAVAEVRDRCANEGEGNPK